MILHNDSGDGPDAKSDPFRPPKAPVQVECIHCGRQYDSSQIKWAAGFWCCPMPDCDGKGFGFDIFPVDEDWEDPEGKLFRVPDEGDQDDPDNDGGEDEQDELHGPTDIPF